MRKNLLIVRASDSSLHPKWLPANGQRSFDLFVSAYGQHVDGSKEQTESWEHRLGLKFDALHAFLATNWETVRVYDYVGFPDDDIAASSSDWDQLFAILQHHQLDIAQPSLVSNGNVNLPITRHVDKVVLRWTDFVEVMTPVFSARCLASAWHTFQHSSTGWGLDLRGQMYPSPHYRMAIVDAVQVEHTRRSGSGDIYVAAAKAANLPSEKGRDVAYQEMLSVAKLYSVNLNRRPSELGRIEA